MKNKIKLIAIDFDGTFLDDTHFKQDLSYVDKIRKANISQKIVFASGRATAGIVELVKRLGMNDMVRYIIGHNGAQIYDLKENKMIYSNPIEDDVALGIVNLLLEKGIKNNPIAIHKWEELYTLNYDSRVDIENEVNFTKCVKINDLKEFPEEKIKIMVFSTGIEVDNIYNIVNESIYGDKVTQARSQNILVEMTKKGITKASALEILCKKLNIDLENVLAFGNAENDKEMIKEVGFGYAMKNSEPILLKDAKNITKYTNNENGVEKEIIDILDIK